MLLRYSRYRGIILSKMRREMICIMELYYLSKGNDKDGLSWQEKERVAIERVKLDDMLDFPGLPYRFDMPLQKELSPNAHCFSYINLSKYNIEVAKSEIEKINQKIKFDLSNFKLPKMKKCIEIPVNEIEFQPSGNRRGTILICTPYTYEGDVARYIAQLSFSTNETHGTICYGGSGDITAAQICFWRNGIGRFLYYNMINDSLTLAYVKAGGDYPSGTILYKDKNIIAAEEERKAKQAKSLADYKWLQKHMPEKCPKSLNGYKRMKTQNTKNFQVLRQLAAERGRAL